jgi:hypothetical protein
MLVKDYPASIALTTHDQAQVDEKRAECISTLKLVACGYPRTAPECYQCRSDSMVMSQPFDLAVGLGGSKQ